MQGLAPDSYGAVAQWKEKIRRYTCWLKAWYNLLSVRVEHMKNLCKKAIIFIFLLAAMSPAFSDSQTLSTEISAVSNGISGFGMGLFPSGTTFRYYKNFAISDALKNRAQFSIQFDFGLNNVLLLCFHLCLYEQSHQAQSHSGTQYPSSDCL